MSQQTDAALDRLLEMAVEAGASDVHLKAGSSPKVRLRGSLAPFGSKSALSAELLKNWALTMLGKERFLKFQQDLEIDFAYQVPGVARFRVNAHHQRGAVGMVMRVVPSVVRSVVELQLPEVLHEICSEKRGLVLVTGATGSGKSTTLAAMIDHINASEPLNIVTIEDPVEFAFRDKRASIIQREVGQDTESFNRALRSALRQDPDVILIGEMRDMETVEIAMTAAETGHLVLSTLHTNGAHETINRVIGVFPPYQQESARRQLAQILRAVVSQRLVPTKDGKGRIAACEIMRASLRIKELIQDPERTHEIPESLEQTQVTLRTQTFDQALLELLKSDKITYDTALGYANSPDDLALRISGVSGAADGEFDPKTGEKPAKPNVSEHLEEDGIERFGE
jgi:twitching motility protein PilT